jgi:50S ribosomal subunit-associated GTPase HflX
MKEIPITQKEKMQEIAELLETIGYTVLDFKTDIDNKSMRSGIIKLKIIPCNIVL